MWLSAIFAGIVLAYILFQINSRLKALESSRGKGFSETISVSAADAIVKSKRFGELTGIKSIVEGGKYKDWTKADNEKWHKSYADKVSNLAYVHFTYLVNEDAYYVSTHKGVNPYIVFRKYKTDLIYSAVVVGEVHVPHDLELRIYERFTRDAKGTTQCKLSVCLYYRKGILSSKGDDFQILCEFPLFPQEKRDETAKQLGFEVEKTDGDPTENDFGEHDYLSFPPTYKKNGVEITTRS